MTLADLVGGSPAAAAVLFGLTAARLVPIFLLVPFFGGRHVPAVLRVAFAGALLLVVAPLHAEAMARVGVLSALSLVGIAAKEVTVGLLLAFLAALPFQAAQAAGGIAFAAATGDRTGEGGAPAELTLLLGVVVFFAIDGHLLFTRALAASFEAIPLLDVPSAAAASRAGDIALAATAQTVLAAVGLAAPVLVAQLVTDVALGLVARGPGGAAVALAPVRGLLVAGMLMLSLGTMALAMRGELLGALARLRP